MLPSARDVGDTLAVELSYRVLTELAPELVVRVTAEGALAFASPYAEVLLGQEPASLLGRPALSLIAADDRELVQARLEALQPPGLTRDSCAVRMVARDGALVPVQLALYAAREAKDHDAREFVWVARELPRADAKPKPRSELVGPPEASPLSGLVGALQLVQLRLDMQGKIVHINEPGLRALGYEAGQLLGKSAQQKLWRGLIRLNDLIATVARDGCTKVEVPLRCRDGSQRTMLGALQLQRAQDGTPLAVDVLLRDVSDERRSSFEMVHAREAAEAGSRAKSAFLANMSHEIRTPMNAIIGMTHLALAADPPPRLREYLTKIQDAGGSLLDIINDILDVSKIEAGKLTLELVPFELDRLFEAVTNVVAVRAAERELELHLAVDPALPELLIGDRVRLGQVLMNLAGNAVKFTERGEVVIAADLIQRVGSQARVRLAVRDSGVGLSEEQKMRLFEPYQQLDSASSRRYRGSGLGLAISQELVHRMGSEIQVESTPGEGSEFWFELLLGVPDGSQPLRSRLRAKHDLRVLVLDDGALARELLTRNLLALGFTVCAVASAEEALRALRDAERKKQPFQLALVDAGPARPVLRELSSAAWTGPRPELVLMSARPREDSAGSVRAFLRKPFSRSALIDTILELVDARRGGARTSSAPPPGPERDRPLSGLSLLVVEDNEINQILARDLLESAGAGVVLAGDGQKALDLCATLSFDLVLMDVQMPGMDGHQTTRKLRAQPRTAAVPIIAMTAHAFDAERKKCLESGMNAHVSKPINPPELVRTVLQWARPEATEPTPAPRREATPRAPSFDPNALSIVFRDPARQLAFLRKFVDSARVMLADLHGAWERRAEAEISFAGHKLKSSAKACGAHALAELCAQLEEHARHGDWEKLGPLEGRAEQLLLEVSRHVEALEARR